MLYIDIIYIEIYITQSNCIACWVNDALIYLFLTVYRRTWARILRDANPRHGRDVERK